MSISFIPGLAVDIEMNMSEFNFINDPKKQVIQNRSVNHTHQFGGTKTSASTITRRLIDSKTLDAMIGLSASSRYRYIKKGLLPRPVRWPGCKNLWDFQEVCAYIERNNASGRMVPPPPDKVEEVDGLAHGIFSVNDLKNKSAEVPYTPSTTEGEHDALGEERS